MTIDECELKFNTVDKIIMSADMGRHVYQCIQEAMAVSILGRCKVELKHNDMLYQIDGQEIISTVLKQGRL